MTFSQRVGPQAADAAAKQADASQVDSNPAASPRVPRGSFLRRCITLFGVASVAYMLGALVIFFDLPSSSFLRGAFVGGAAWFEQKQAPKHLAAGRTAAADPVFTIGKTDKPGQACDGYTLCMCSDGTRAALINMRGEVVHQWRAPLQMVWPDHPNLPAPGNESLVYFNDGHLYANGDLLVLVEGPTDARKPANGYGLVKLDKDSRVLWKYAANCHHALDVGEDGTIYALSNDFVDRMPEGLAYLPTPCLVDCVDIVSAEGKPVRRIRLLEAFKKSPYASLLCTLEKPKMFSDISPPDEPMPAIREEMRRRDVLHTNAVAVLGRRLAPKFPLFKAGQLLLSPRHLDAIAVLDPETDTVVWAARGPWHAQHDPTFLDNGRLLLFDNLGSARGSRVLEYDPQTQAFPWSYPDETGKRFLSRLRGMCQRLPNGNTLIVISDGGEMLEVTPGHELVWSSSCAGFELHRARRFMADQLSFLTGDQRARP
jgi:hypothetical protein